MSNETLRVRVALMGDTVVMRVFEMPERFRGNFDFTASNGVEVMSDGHPALVMRDEETILLRGDDAGLDNKITGVDLYDAEEAREAYDKIVMALKEAKADMERIMSEEPTERLLDNTLTFDESKVI